MTNARTDIDEVVLRLAHTAGAAGICIADISGFDAKQVDGACRRLVKWGDLHRGKLGHRTMRLFVTPDYAAAYERNYKSGSRAPDVVGPRRARAQWSADAPTHYPKDEHGHPLYKHTVAPPPPERPLRTNTHTNWG